MVKLLVWLAAPGRLGAPAETEQPAAQTGWLQAALLLLRESAPPASAERQSGRPVPAAQACRG